MANINKELNQIKTATYGKDVRGSIHDGIKKINNETENATDLSDDTKRRQDSVEQQFDDLQNNYTEDSPSDAEIVAARTNTETSDNYNTIGRRLDEENKKITTQLADIAMHVKEFGAVGDGNTDDTKAINEAIDYASQNNIKLIFNGYKYKVNEVILKDNVIIDLTNSLIEKIPTDKDRYRILDINKKENITIINPRIKGDRKSHITTPSNNPDNFDGFTGEWGMGINIIDSKNIDIYNPFVTDCWGDGIYIGGSKSENIIENNINIHGTYRVENCRRQGISIVKGQEIFIDEIIAKDINGTKPSFAIDIEPNNPKQIVRSINVNKIKAINCRGGVTVVSAGGEMDVSFGDVFIDQCDKPIYTNYLKKNDTEDNGDRGIKINANNTLLINNVFIPHTEGVPIEIRNNILGVFPNIIINNITIGEIKQNDGSPERVIYNRLTSDSNYFKFGNITIQNINLINLNGENKNNKISVFHFTNTIENKKASLENITINNYISKDDNLSNPYISNAFLKNVHFIDNKKFLHVNKRKIENGINLFVKNQHTAGIDSRVTYAELYVFGEYVEFYKNEEYENYSFVLNDEQLDKSVDLTERQFRVYGKPIFIWLDDVNEKINIKFKTYDVVPNLRPYEPENGAHVFDRSIQKAIWYSQGRWVDANGNEV